MTILKIDTSKQNEVKVELIFNGKKTTFKKKFTKGSEVLLPLIKKILDDNNLRAKQIDNVVINRGPGSFTGIRVGLSVANALAHFLKIPINNSSDKLVEPIYK